MADPDAGELGRESSAVAESTPSTATGPSGGSGWSPRISTSPWSRMVSRVVTPLGSSSGVRPTARTTVESPLGSFSSPAIAAIRCAFGLTTMRFRNGLAELAESDRVRLPPISRMRSSATDSSEV